MCNINKAVFNVILPSWGNRRKSLTFIQEPHYSEMSYLAPNQKIKNSFPSATTIGFNVAPTSMHPIGNREVRTI